MGDGNIGWGAAQEDVKISLADEKLENDTPRSDDNVSMPATPSTKRSITSTSGPAPEVVGLPIEVEELHRNTNNIMNTPDISIGSITPAPGLPTPRRNGRRNFRVYSADNEFGLPLGPAAGLGPQEAVANDANGAIFSVKGTRSFKINRHRDNVTVFPSGCMGVKSDEDAKATVSDPVDVEVTDEACLSKKSSSPSSPKIPLRRPGSATRNPLTGEGYENDSKKHGSMKKRDGNPVLGQGYDDHKNSRHKKVPPGGYSKGLW